MDRNKRLEFGRWLKARRIEAGLTYFRASELLGYQSHGTINLLEQGKGTLPVEKIIPLAETYGIPLSALLEQIRDCEPALFAKYTTLRKQFLKMAMERIAGSDNPSYVNKDDPTLYIM